MKHTFHQKSDSPMQRRDRLSGQRKALGDDGVDRHHGEMAPMLVPRSHISAPTQGAHERALLSIGGGAERYGDDDEEPDTVEQPRKPKHRLIRRFWKPLAILLFI